MSRKEQANRLNYNTKSGFSHTLLHDGAGGPRECTRHLLPLFSVTLLSTSGLI